LKHISLDISPHTDWSVAGDKFRPVKDSKYNIRTIDSIQEPYDNRYTYMSLYIFETEKKKTKLMSLLDKHKIYKNGELYIGHEDPFVGDHIINILKIYPKIQDEEYLIYNFHRIFERYREEYQGLFMATQHNIHSRIPKRPVYITIINQAMDKYHETHTT